MNESRYYGFQTSPQFKVYSSDGARKQVLFVLQLILQCLQLLLLPFLEVLLPRHIPELRNQRVLLLLRLVFPALNLLQKATMTASQPACSDSFPRRKCYDCTGQQAGQQ